MNCLQIITEESLLPVKKIASGHNIFLLVYTLYVFYVASFCFLCSSDPQRLEQSTTQKELHAEAW